MILSSCVGNLYKLTIKDEQKFIINKLKTYYKEGDEIVIKTEVLTDVGLQLYVNDEFHSAQTAVETNKGYIWEYYVIMPNYNIEISFKVVDGFLTDQKELFTETFSSSVYGYDYVYVFNKNLDYKNLEIKYGINKNTDYYLIDSVEKYYEIYYELSGTARESLNLTGNYVWLYIKRVAGASNFIKIDYGYLGDLLIIEFPFYDSIGNDAIYNCVDLVRISLTIYEGLQKDETGKLIISSK